MRNLLRGAHDSVRRLAEFALSEGWTLSRSNSGHLKFSKSGFTPIFTYCTPSDRRTERNTRALLRRAEAQNNMSRGIQ
ncbi:MULTISPECIES: hypothetical protein [Pseudomonas]|uniref:Type II toxin-antitoxin system HicA family toxin n=2 Tax=Pseudomonas putida group TaxID=136845 RepID=A0AAP7FK70_9PSED|nr:MULTISPECIES: hypothetical protein [Pseudomonas]HEP8964593.1 hypothetical protein [Pseudomonas aeruginosa]AYN98869.1 hypothetical protein D8767_07755 [Pseudomonas sp. LTGT-11-2Z]ELS0926068.1 hypothetical protein [Pseudomonas putida]MBH3417287.1 hypothetical protein [Pseudomonas putida]MCE0945155.1 hypothetical protein [Pseudomonas asiatica]